MKLNYLSCLREETLIFLIINFLKSVGGVATAALTIDIHLLKFRVLL